MSWRNMCRLSRNMGIEPKGLSENQVWPLRSPSFKSKDNSEDIIPGTGSRSQHARDVLLKTADRSIWGCTRHHRDGYRGARLRNPYSGVWLRPDENICTSSPGVSRTDPLACVKTIEHVNPLQKHAPRTPQILALHTCLLLLEPILVAHLHSL
ncbi:hypothetical protein BDV59DRAFT_185664 [Aspergillus ambiguus]|uniref:uncharacterized protein n=1 Tax=Aspergillus ambiguus TaxID=176160 RepID=UPI003CCDE699